MQLLPVVGLRYYHHWQTNHGIQQFIFTPKVFINQWCNRTDLNYVLLPVLGVWTYCWLEDTVNGEWFGTGIVPNLVVSVETELMTLKNHIKLLPSTLNPTGRRLREDDNVIMTISTKSNVKIACNWASWWKKQNSEMFSLLSLWIKQSLPLHIAMFFLQIQYSP